MRASRASGTGRGLLSEYTAAGEAERDRIIAEATSEAQRIRPGKARRRKRSFRAKEKLEAEIVNETVSRGVDDPKSADQHDHHRLVTGNCGQLEADGQRKVHGGQNDAWFYHW